MHLHQVCQSMRDLFQLSVDVVMLVLYILGFNGKR